ncbi:hypothetical protein [Ferrithrix thermotolerans]|uniref:hypothetical protein n=1 Tax=Ferrithrix thermotolerans TaxID=209649 RepID=UPI001160800A|nr:hypothetical protein [Ferrithrix thermotolerans]
MRRQIAYCQDANRKGSCEHEQLDFLGYRFRPRLAKNRRCRFFVGFAPAISDTAAKEIRHQIRRWRLHLHSDIELVQLATFVKM